MSWESKTVENQRKEFAEAAEGCRNFSALCREYGITRKTGYKWVERYKQGQSLSDQSRKPMNSPGKTPKETEEKILHLREENPGWGAATLKRVLENEGESGIPSARTVNNILNRNNCIDPGESLKRQPFERYEKDECNEMWQTDFKGEFKTKDGKYCYPLDILDDHSRFAIRIKASDSTENVVIKCFEEAFIEYGIPKSVLSDNGAQFAGFKHGYTRFEKWLMCLDILPIHSRVKHPQTQGKIERFHRSMKEEFLKYHTFENAADANASLQEWRYKYNFVRPHEALNLKCPGEVYKPSERQYPKEISRWEYGGQYHVLKVNNWGYVRFSHFQVYLSETMIGEYIEFRPSSDGETFHACFRNFRIADFSAETGERLNRNIRRI